MSHFTVLVITGKTELDNTDGETLVHDLLEPFNEDGEWRAEGTHWDWYEVGGRWEGALGTYEPGQDARNYSKCRLCDGTNVRTTWAATSPDRDWCNGCVEPDPVKAKYRKLVDGTNLFGMSRNFSNVPTGENVKLVRDIRGDFQPHAYVTPSGNWVEAASVGWFGSTGNENPEYASQWNRTIVKYADHVAVLVDCHV